MNNPLRFATALGAAGLSGALIAASALLFGSPASSQDMMGMEHGQAGAATTCGAQAQPCAPDFYSEMAAVNARMHGAMAVKPSNDVDQDFIRMMIPHHQGAIDMAVVFLKYGRDERLRRLAQAIIAEQGQEVAYLNSLLITPATEGAAPSATPATHSSPHSPHP
jgi:uncharacterized protein (DUF305 family)